MRHYVQVFLAVVIVALSVDFCGTVRNYHRLLEYALAGVVSVCVCADLCLHTTQERVRSALQGTTVAICLFLCLRMAKLYVPPALPDTERFFWYLFYPCFLALGYYTMCVAYALDHASTKFREEKYFSLIFALDLVVLLLIFTNDYHQLIFTFQANFVNCNDDYGSGLLEVPLKAYIMLQFIIPVAVLLRDAWRYTYFRPAMLLPLGILVYAIIYNILYSMGVSIFRSGETVIVNSVSIVSFWYCAFTTGLVSFDTYYKELFAASNIHAHLAERKLRQELVAKIEENLAQEREQMLSAVTILEGNLPCQKRQIILGQMRLTASLWKKQCLLLLQGEQAPVVPAADYKAALEEACHYAQEAGCFVTLSVRGSSPCMATQLALTTHRLVVETVRHFWTRAAVLMLKVTYSEKEVELSLLFDREECEASQEIVKVWQECTSFVAMHIAMSTTVDTCTLKLKVEVIP